jgi:hypothetical protein
MPARRSGCQRGRRYRSPRHEIGRSPRPAPAVPHLGSRQGDGPARPLHGRQRCAGVLLRPAQPMAARHQREHQRPATPIPPTRPASPTDHRPSSTRSLPSSTDALDKRSHGSHHHKHSTSCCDDRLSSPSVGADRGCFQNARRRGVCIGCAVGGSCLQMVPGRLPGRTFDRGAA